MPYNSRAKQKRPLLYSLPHNFVQEPLFKGMEIIKSSAVNHNHKEA